MDFDLNRNSGHLLRVGVKSVLADTSLKRLTKYRSRKKVQTRRLLNLNQPTVRFVLRFRESNQPLTYNNPLHVHIGSLFAEDPHRNFCDLCV